MLMLLLHATSTDIKLFLARARFTRVPLVSRQDRDEVRTSIVDGHLPLHDLQTQVRGLAREDEIACAGINGRKEKYNERKASKALEKSSKPDKHHGQTNQRQGKCEACTPKKASVKKIDAHKYIYYWVKKGKLWGKQHRR
jgi:hypothetical protein